MLTVKTFGLVAALAFGSATAATAAEIPDSLLQLDQFVAQNHPFEYGDHVRGISHTFEWARNQAVRAYAAGDIATGQSFEGFARHLAGASETAPQPVAAIPGAGQDKNDYGG